MRNQILVAVLSTLATFSAGAQQTEKRPSMEPVGSPFTYEVLGATPSLRLHMQEPRAETPATAAQTRVAGKADPKAAAREQSNAIAGAEDSRAAQAAKQ